VRKPDNDADLLRIVASAANEVVDVASTLPAKKVAAALNNVAQRYARVLRLNTRAVVDALQEAKDVLRQGGTPTPAGRRQADSADVEPAAEAAPGETR
jgi:non-specific serine/threonine protein kinase